MKKLLIAIICVTVFSCSKTGVLQSSTNLVIEAMTSGQWKITNFVNNGVNSTSDYSGYTFQFKKDYTVDAIKSGVVEQSGTWSADANNKTITSTFPTSTLPISLLNGTWTITNSTWTAVDANQTINGQLRTLRLDKI